MFNEWYDLIFDNFHLIVEKGEKIGVTEKAKKYYLSGPPPPKHHQICLAMREITPIYFLHNVIKYIFLITLHPPFAIMFCSP